MSAMESKTRLRIGIDFGGVCTPLGAAYESNNPTDAKMDMPGCCEALLELKAQGHYLVLVSFCGKNRANSTRRNLPLSKYFHKAYFVRNRAYKNDICKAEALDVLIDDRQEILDTLTETSGILFDNWKSVMQQIPKFESKGLTADETIDVYRLIYK